MDFNLAFQKTACSNFTIIQCHDSRFSATFLLLFSHPPNCSTYDDVPSYRVVDNPPTYNSTTIGHCIHVTSARPGFYLARMKLFFLGGLSITVHTWLALPAIRDMNVVLMYV